MRNSVDARGHVRRLLSVLLAMALLFAMSTAPAPATTDDGATDESLVSVIVRATPGASEAATAVVESLGGVVGVSLDVISGFEAAIPASALVRLQASSVIAAITPNATLQLTGSGWEDLSTLGGNDPNTHSGSLYETAGFTGARDLWRSGYTGAGIDVALIDSGVAPVNGLTVAGKIVNGPDLSFESQYDGLRYLDTFGHGTHLAGIIAGRDDAVTGDVVSDAKNNFVGIAPDARIVSVKVADAHGVTDVSQVIAAIDWVVQNRQSGDLNIRVLNLSFGTDSTQDYVLDPLAFAVEQAWNAGIVVVVSAGNDGLGTALRNPATDPFVVAVGALDRNGTKRSSDDFIADFSSCGVAERHVDVVAPGRSLISLRNPGSYADAENPGAVVGTRLFLGSGTSQAAAVVSGGVALMLDENPNLNPDQVKELLMYTADSVRGSYICKGAGKIDLDSAAFTAPLTPQGAAQNFVPSTGMGSLEEARGSDHLSDGDVVLQGEIDIMGNEFDSEDWSEASAAGATWSGGDWNGATWSGASWSGSSWSGATWSAATWSGSSWSGSSWSEFAWSGATWSGATWSGATWSGATWSGSSWSGATWSGATWSGATWSSSSRAASGFTWD